MGSKLRTTMMRALSSGVDTLRAFAYSAPVHTEEETPEPERCRIGLALGGGFARGVAHVGVLKVLTENEIPIDAVAGVSAGSIAGAFYAAGKTPDHMANLARRVRWNGFARWTVARLGLATNGRMEGLLRQALHCTTFEELKKPLAVVASDISTGEEIVFTRGELIPPLRASCSFPGLFTPVSYQGRLLVDGAVTSSVPVAAVQGLGVDVVIGVHLKSNGTSDTPTNMFQVVGKAFQIVESRTGPTWRNNCDLVIEPDVSDFAWDDFKRVDELIEVGEQAAREALPAIRDLVESRSLGVRKAV